MRRRVPIALSAAERAVVARWRAGMLGAVAILIVAVLVLPAFKGQAEDGGSRPAPSRDDPICASLDRLASSVIAERAQSGPSPDVAEIADMIAQMRRGRRTCETGWPQRACRDYQAILARAQDRGDFSVNASPCAATTAAIR